MYVQFSHKTLHLLYLRFNGLGYCCGYIYKITGPRLGDIKTKPLGMDKGIECSSVANIHCHVAVTFHFYHHICGKRHFKVQQITEFVFSQQISGSYL